MDSLNSLPLQEDANVRVVVDGLTESGRHLLRGVLAYARSHTRWIIHVEMALESRKGPDWERDTATIYAAPVRPLLETILARGHMVVNCLAHHQDLNLPTVRSDDHAIGRMGADYFIQRGFEHFLFEAGPDRSFAPKLRWDGFVERLAESNLTATWHDRDRTGDRFTDRLGDLCEAIKAMPRPLAAFFSHDALARVTGDYLSAAGVYVPEHVSMMGVDNDELQCEISRPPLSSIAIPYEEIGRQAARMLHRLLDGQPASNLPILIKPAGVIERESTDVVASDSPQLAEALKFIRQHACDPCGVDQVLDHVLVSRRWLETQFRKRFARSPHDEITRVRMDRAKILLRDRNLPLKVVAERVGYGHLQNFVSIFRRTTGQTPAVFRRQIISGR